MPFAGTTFTEVVGALDEVVEIIKANKERLRRADAEYSAIVSSMTAAGTEYGPIVGVADALLAADTTNPSLIALQSAIAGHLADFTALSNEAATKDALINT